MKKSGYALKREQGLVPFRYNKDSERFLQGAWKNWPAGMKPENRDDRVDRRMLENRTTKYHRFVFE